MSGARRLGDAVTTLRRGASSRIADQVDNDAGDDEWKLAPAVTGALSSQPRSDD